VRRTIRELKICMFCLGVKSIAELQRTKLLKGL
jgi:isopentenyl diphosphate isomerase/L-lactate dehydrogenase-like FMN-dependent dehydrogenase